MTGNRHECFVSCLPGLERIVGAELLSLGIRHHTPTTGGVAFYGNDRDIYLATVGLRSATRVLVRLATFKAPSFPELEAAAVELPWHDWFPRVPDMRVTVNQSRLFHTGAIDERMRVASASHLRRGDPATPAVAIVRIDHDQCTVSVCAAGEPLHHRGWRGATGKAPLRPTIAAALLHSIGWTGDRPLVDPMCGSGTIPIEAARSALGRPAFTADRRFAFGSWPRFAPGTWGSVKATVESRPSTTPTVIASDRDAGAAALTRTHCARAGVAAHVTVTQAPISAAELPDTERGWIVTNPPWGGRIGGGGDLRDLYAALGNLISDRPGWQVALVTADLDLARATGLQLTTLFSTTAGGQRITAFRGSHRTTTLPSATMRP